MLMKVFISLLYLYVDVECGALKMYTNGKEQLSLEDPSGEIKSVVNIKDYYVDMNKVEIMCVSEISYCSVKLRYPIGTYVDGLWSSKNGTITKGSFGDGVSIRTRISCEFDCVDYDHKVTLNVTLAPPTNLNGRIVYAYWIIVLFSGVLIMAAVSFAWVAFALKEQNHSLQNFGENYFEKHIEVNYSSLPLHEHEVCPEPVHRILDDGIKSCTQFPEARDMKTTIED